MLKGFEEIRDKLHKDDKKREELIKKGRDLLKISKRIIFSVHREDLKEAEKILKEANKIKKEFEKIASHDTKLLYEGSHSEACQEYVEAICFLNFVKNEELPTYKELNVNYNDYLMGICDLTGELARKAVSLGGRKDIKHVSEIRNFVEFLYGEFLKFDLRNGSLRKKYDSIKWNLKKLEEIIYDIKIKS